MDASDEILFERAAAGDPAACESLVIRHQAGVVRFIRDQNADAHHAEDIAQEVFLRVFQKAHQFKSRSGFRTWLYGIARNTARDFLRKRRREQKRIVEKAESARRRPTTRIGVPWKEDPHGFVHALLARVDEPFRSAVTLVDLHEFSYEEAAKVLDCPVRTVSSRVFRGREQLAELVRAAKAR